MKSIRNTTLGGDAIKLTTSKIISMTISMIIAMLLSRFRTLEEYGTYSQLLMIINLATSLLMLGVPKSINYFLARSETNNERQRFISVYYTYNTLLSIIVGFVLVCTTSQIETYFNNELIRRFKYFLLIYPWAKIIMSSIENLLITSKKTSMLMVYRVLNSIFLLFTILVVQICDWNFRVYMFLFTLVETVFAVSVYFIAKNISGKLTLTFDKVLIKNILSFSIPIGLASVIGTLNIELDKLMIGNFLNTEQLAIYTNASKEMPLTIVASSLTAVLLPSLSRMLKDGKNQKAIEMWGYATEISYIIICFLATGFFVYAHEVMMLLYSEKYLPGVSVFRVYNVVLLLRCTYFGMILSAKGKTKFIFYSSLISLVLNIILNYILFYVMGLIGPAISTFLSQFIINMIQLIFTGKTIKVSFRKIFPWRRLGIVTVVNFSLGILFYYVKILLPLEPKIGEVFESILLGLIWGILYLLIFRKEIKEKWTLLNKGDRNYD